MYSIFGGNVEDLRIWLADGRFPDGWEPKNREALGHSITVSFVDSSLFPGDLARTLNGVNTASANHLTRDRV